MRVPSAKENARRAVALLGAVHAPKAASPPTLEPTDPLAPIPPPTDVDFIRFQRLIRAEAGIHLPDSKRSLLAARLQKRLRELGIRSFNAYYRHVTRDSSDELHHMLNCICTNETRFFREPKQFDLLVQRVIPRWRHLAESGRRPRRLRVWSAGCSSGEEPYSLAMTLLKQLPACEGWIIDILATDLSTRVLDRGREGVYPLKRREEIPRELFLTFMRRGVGDRAGTMAVGPEVRAVVRFARHNLCASEAPDVRPFDLILCRNVLIYFDAPTKKQVVASLIQNLEPEGLLFLGHSEALSGSGHGLRPVGPMAYVRGSAATAWA